MKAPRHKSRFSKLVSEAVMAIRRVALLTMETAILRQYSHMLSVMLQILIKSFSWILLLLSFLVMALGFWSDGQLLTSREYITTQL